MGFINYVIYISTILISSILGIFVYLRNPHKKEVQEYAFFTIAIVGCIASLFLCYFLSESYIVTFFGRLAYSLGLLIPFFFYRFTYSFPQETIKFSKSKRLFFITFTLVVFFITLFTGLVDREEIISQNNRISVFGDLYFLYIVGFVINSIAGLYLLFAKLKKSHNIIKTQLQIITLGFFLGILFGGLTNILFPFLFGNDSLQPFGPLATVIFNISLAYVIIKHHFMDIRLIIARTVSFTLLILSITLVYALFSVFVLSLFTGLNLDSKVFAISAALLVIMAFIIQPIRHGIEKVTDRIFFKDRYDAGKLLYGLALKMASTIKLDELMNDLLQVLLSQMRVSKGALILTKDHTIGQVAHAGFGINHKFDQTQLLSIFAENKTLVFDDLVEGSLKEFMRIQGFIIVVPLLSEDKSIGILVMGEKLSGDLYTDSDIQVLETFAKEAVVAIENARSYEEIQRFNVTLREEVDKATKELKELAQQQKDQMDVVGHEARTPLTTISQELNLILNMILPEQKRKDWQKGDVKPEDAKRVIEGLTSMNIATKQEASIINNMVEAARIDKQTFELNYSTFDLIELIQLAIKESQGRRESSNKKGNITFQPKIHVLEVEADKTRIKQCIDGLLTNAEKYGINPQNKILDITVSVKAEKGKATISIQDHGIGIDEGDMEKLGKKFSRLNPYAKGGKLARPGGTGLGLYTFKGILERHKGQLIIESEGIGKGSTFTIELPVRKVINNDTQPVNEVTSVIG